MGNTAQYQALPTDGKESSEIPTVPLTENKGGTTGNIPEFKEEAKHVFIKELKAKYKQLYDSTHSLQEKLHCVDKIFVESGIELLETSWLPLKSYNNVLRDGPVKAKQPKRRIIEGGLGYGKSTLCFQYVYDWSNSVQESFLKDVEILIFLRLKHLIGVYSIQKAIKQFLLPRNSELNESDIQTVLQKSASVVIILDGFDEYQDKNIGTRSDIIKIMMSKMFPEFEVILTTDYLPEQYQVEITRLRLTGFDETAQDEYFRKAVVADDTMAADRIKRRIRENPFLKDLCQMPFFFVMFAHISHDNEICGKLNTVTSFFEYIMEYFYNMLRNNRKLHDFNEDGHTVLEKIAFDCLIKRNQQTCWSKVELCRRLGDDCYHHYVRIGILVEEEVCNARTSRFPHLNQCQTEVTFYHKLFREWYAAKHLAKCATEWTYEKLKKELQHALPNDHQYFYRFACGLNQFSAGKIVEYVKEKVGGNKLAALCILEQGEQVAGILDAVRDLCSREITVEKEPDRWLQRSIVRTLEIASSNEISILCVRLYDCYSTVDLSVGNIQLKFSTTIPVLATLKKLWIRETDRKIAIDDFKGILRYSSLCLGLEKLWFWGCLLPQSAQADSLSVLRSRNVEVLWRIDNDTPNHVLNLQSGLWKNDDSGSVMTDDDYEILVRRREWVTL